MSDARVSFGNHRHHGADHVHNRAGGAEKRLGRDVAALNRGLDRMIEQFRERFGGDNKEAEVRINELREQFNDQIAKVRQSGTSDGYLALAQKLVAARRDFAQGLRSLGEQLSAPAPTPQLRTLDAEGVNVAKPKTPQKLDRVA